MDRQTQDLGAKHDRQNNPVTHLLVGRYGSPAVECRQARAKIAFDFRDYNAEVKAGGINSDACCQKCFAAYTRRLEALRAKKAGGAK